MGALRQLNRRRRERNVSCRCPVLQIEPLEPRVLLSLQYSVLDLGTLGGTFGVATDINDAGQVTGYATTSAGQTRAFLWSNGVMIELPTDASWIGGDYSYGHDINNQGKVALSLDYSVGERASYWDGSNIWNIHTIASSYVSRALAINNSVSPAIAGYYFDPNQVDTQGNPTSPRAFRWSNADGGMITLDARASRANDINDSNQVVGKALVTTQVGAYYHATVWGANGQATDIDSGNRYGSEAVGDNSSGQVVGWKHTGLGSQFHAFLWTAAGGLQDLETLEDGDYNSDARAVNDVGQIVGASDTWVGSEKTYRAFVYENGAMTNLETLVPNLSGWKLLAAEDVNNAGQIVGWGERNGQTRAFLLTPVADTHPPQATLQAQAVTELGGTEYTFTVQYTDNQAVKVSSLGTGDVAVSGPGGFSQTATFVSVDNATDGTPRTATYRITPPGGSWDTADNGSYTVTVQAGQVTDKSNNAMAGKAVGTFQVNVTLKPTADLADPANGSSIPMIVLNGRRTIDVTFNDRSGTGLNTATIADAEQEFQLVGASASTVLLNGAATLVPGTTNTYRYAITNGNFAVGIVQVQFIAGAWADMQGAVNIAEQEGFNVTPPDMNGPRVVDLAPKGMQSRGLDHLDVTFSESINYSTFTSGDVVITNPKSQPVAVKSITKVTDTKFRLGFDGLQEVGTYEVKIGPDVRDYSGNQMNQDQDTVNGETPQDVYGGQFALAPTNLRVIAQDPAADEMQYGTIEEVRVTFSEAINAQTFTLDDVHILTPSATLRPMDIRVDTGNTYRISFEPQQEAGTYILVVGSDIENPAGDKMNQDGDAELGERVDDAYLGGFTVAASNLRIEGQSPTGTVRSPVSHVEVTFTENINPNTFDKSDMQLTGPQGEIPVTEVKNLKDNTYTIQFAPQTVNGHYRIAAGPNISNAKSQLMNQDRDNFPGESLDDRYVGGFTIDDKEYDWIIIDLGTLGGNWSMAMGLNDECRVVGAALTKYADLSGGTDPATVMSGLDVRPSIWEPSDLQMHALGTLGGNYGMAYEINDQGDMVGLTANVGKQEFGVQWRGVTPTSLWNDDPATAINAMGQAVGGDYYYDGTVKKAEDMVKPPANKGGWRIENARDISETGYFVGQADSPNTDAQGRYVSGPTFTHGYMMDKNGNFTELPPPIGATNPDVTAEATGINASGSIVVGAYSYTYYDTHVQDDMEIVHACIWQDGTATDINKISANDGLKDDFTGAAMAVNDAGRVVGTYGGINWSTNPPSQVNEAFVYENGQVYTIWDLAGTDHNFKEFLLATDVNSEGDVCGYGIVKNGVFGAGEKHAFLMTRDKPPKPTADLKDPTDGAIIPMTALNERKYIDVNFWNGVTITNKLVEVNPQSIVDDEPEFALEGPNASKVTVNGKGTLLKKDNLGYTYRYTFTGEFTPGLVYVHFLEGAWVDQSGQGGKDETEEFTAGLDPDYYDKNGPDNSPGQASVIITDGKPQQYGHNIHLEDDQDWVKFTLTEPASIVAEARCQTGTLDMYLHQSNLEIIERDYISGQNAKIMRTGADMLAAGTYYISVESLLQRHTVPYYDLLVKVFDVQAEVTETHGWDGLADDPQTFGRYFTSVKMELTPLEVGQPEGFTFKAELRGADAGAIDKVEFKLGNNISFADTFGGDGWKWPNVPIEQLTKDTALTVTAYDEQDKISSVIYRGMVDMEPLPKWLEINPDKTYWDGKVDDYFVSGIFQPDFLEMAYTINPIVWLFGGKDYRFKPGLDVLIRAELDPEKGSVRASAGLFVDLMQMGVNVWDYRAGHGWSYTPEEMTPYITMRLATRSLEAERIWVDFAKADAASLKISLGLPNLDYLYDYYYFPNAPLLFFPYKDSSFKYPHANPADINWLRPEIYTVVNPLPSFPPWPDFLTEQIGGLGMGLTLEAHLGLNFKMLLERNQQGTDWDIPRGGSSYAVEENFKGTLSGGFNWFLGSMQGNVNLIGEEKKTSTQKFWRENGVWGSEPAVNGKFRVIVETDRSSMWNRDWKPSDIDKRRAGWDWGYQRWVFPNNPSTEWVDDNDWWDLGENVRFLPGPLGSTSFKAVTEASSASILAGESPTVVSDNDSTAAKLYAYEAGATLLAQTENAAPEDAVDSYQPVLARRGDGTVFRAYIRDADADPTKFAPEVYLQRLSSSQGWSTPIQITNDGQGKATPTLGFAADGDVIVAWTQMTIYNENSIRQSFDSAEIFWARIDEASGTVQEKQQLTQNSRMDGKPALGVAGTGVLTWGQYDSSAKNWIVQYARWDDDNGFIPNGVALSDADSSAWGARIAQGPGDYGLAVWLSGARDNEGRISQALPQYRIWNKQTGSFGEIKTAPVTTTSGNAVAIDVAFVTQEQAAVAWAHNFEGGGFAIYAAFYNLTTESWSPVRQILTGPVLGVPKVDVSTNGEIAITATGWNGRGQLWSCNGSADDPQGNWSRPENIWQQNTPVLDASAAFAGPTDLITTWMSGGEQYEQTVTVPAVGELADKENAQYTDGDGTLVTVKITGAGAKLFFTGDNVAVVQGKKGVAVSGSNLKLTHVYLVDNTTKAVLTVTTKGGSVAGATLGGLSGGHLGKLTAPGVDLIGDINLSGSLGSMILHNITEALSIHTAAPALAGVTLKANDITGSVDFDLAGTIKSFQVRTFANGSISADTIGQIKVAGGTFGADVTARTGDILSVAAGGDITGNLSAAESIKQIATSGRFSGVARAGGLILGLSAWSLDHALLSAGNAVQNVVLKGDILDSYVLGGYDVGTDCAFGLQVAGGGDLPGSGDVIGVSAKGTFARSYIGAGVLPHSPLADNAALDSSVFEPMPSGMISNVKFGAVDYYHATNEFGLYAAIAIQPFKIGKIQAADTGLFVLR